MNTETLVLTDLLDCGYADISMLDILYDVDGVVRDSDIYVTADVIRGNCKPEIKKHVNTKNVIYRRQTV